MLALTSFVFDEPECDNFVKMKGRANRCLFFVPPHFFIRNKNPKIQNLII